MKIGLTLPQAGEQATKDNIVDTAKKAEKEGFDSVWVLERLLYPTKPQNPYLGTPDGSLPIQYQRFLEPLETLSFVSANTERIALGTSVIDILFHTPVILAKRLATLDVFSGGRVLAGFGIGWSKDEFQASNIPFHNKGKRADEFIEALKKIWTDNIVEYKGEYYSIPPSIIGPKPIQKPHIPIYLGGFSPNTFERIVKSDANGWLGVAAGPLEQLENIVATMKDHAIKYGKNPERFNHILLTYPVIRESSGDSGTKDQRFPMTGTIDEIGMDIQRIKEIGISHIIFGYNFTPIGEDVDSMISTTKQLSKFAR
ncbi:MAG: TIGR03619 family F420-dependent LLM class oxidoreductase [Nitrososphaeraceae archaeon]